MIPLLLELDSHRFGKACSAVNSIDGPMRAWQPERMPGTVHPLQSLIGDKPATMLRRPVAAMRRRKRQLGGA
jgi:hypothetical protein